MVDNKECFVICPIGEADSDTREHSDLTFNYIIKPVVEEFGYSPNRADMVKESGMITTQIIDKIIKSPLVIADLTDSNPNVFYELAIRHVVKKPYIQMIKSNQQIPFDISGMRTILFDTDLRQADNAKKELRKHIESIKNNKFKPVNPVTHAMSYSAVQKMLDDNTNNESGDISKVVLKSVSDMSSMMADIKSDVQKLKISMNNMGNYGVQTTLYGNPAKDKYVANLEREMEEIIEAILNTEIQHNNLITENKNLKEIVEVKNKLRSLLIRKEEIKDELYSIINYKHKY